MNIVHQTRTLECPWTQRWDRHCCGSRRAIKDPYKRMRLSRTRAHPLHLRYHCNTGGAPLPSAGGVSKDAERQQQRVYSHAQLQGFLAHKKTPPPRTLQ